MHTALTMSKTPSGTSGPPDIAAQLRSLLCPNPSCSRHRRFAAAKPQTQLSPLLTHE